MIIASNKSEFTTIWEASAGVIFFGTPHRGSDFAALAKSLGNLVNLAPNPFGSKTVNTRLLQALERESEDLLSLADLFTSRSKQLRIVTFFETKETPGLNGLVSMACRNIGGLNHLCLSPRIVNPYICVPCHLLDIGRTRVLSDHRS